MRMMAADHTDHHPIEICHYYLNIRLITFYHILYHTVLYCLYPSNNQITRLTMQHHSLSPLILLARCRSFVMIVTLLAWIAHRLVSSNKPTRYASAAYWRASTALLWNLTSCLNSVAIYLTSLMKGSFLIRRSV